MSPRNKLLLLCRCLLPSLTFTVLPAAESPALPSISAAPIAAAVPAGPTPATPQSPAVATTGRPLRKILVADSVEVAQRLVAPPESGFVVLAPALASFDAAELTKRLANGENQIIEERLLAAVAQVVETFLRQNEYPDATAMIPTQRTPDGAVRVLVTLGTRAKTLPITAASEWKIRKINMQGTRWFSESLLREKLRIEQGGMVRFSDLDRAINWTNNNPFRRVRVQLDPVATTGEADLTIAVQEALPLRLMATFDNSGNELIGENRYTASVSYGNLWGRDHQASYQYITTSKPSVFQGHGLDYRVPLPWRHHLQFTASYLKVKALPEYFQGLLVQEGKTLTSDLRYTIPLRVGDNSTEIYAGLNFKESNNNLNWDPEFNNVQVFGTKTNVFQFVLGGSAVRRDKRGAWAVGASLTASPGGINSRNTDAAFDAARHGGEDSARIGAKAAYVYGSVSVQRLLKLPKGWDLTSRFVGQASQANLLSSEQLSIGGSSTVRGFNENIFSGDHGYVFANELMAPLWKKSLPRISKTRGPLETRVLVFFDAANTSVRHRFAGDIKREALASTGVGIRMGLASNFSLSADYGWQLSHLPYPVQDHSRAHVRASLAF